MQIAGTPPIDWGGHAARHAERRSQRDAAAGALRDRAGRPAAGPVAEETPPAQETAARPEKATTEQQIAKFDKRIEHLLNRVTQRFGADTAAELEAQIASLQALYLGDVAATEGAGGEVAAPPRSYRAALADLVHEFKHGAAVAEPVEGDDPAVDVDPVAGDPGAVDEGGTGDTVVVDPPEVTLPVVPPEATDPSELLDVMLTGVPADE